ncbi:MAG: DUF2796 domain-containing protein [Hyphomicrobium sp.]|nr:DUF2796 domain-containing protein [Hyphomicrobium sp.]
MTALAVIGALALVSAARAEDEHRELGSHVHGHGTLNIAVEDKRVAMELKMPGMDLVGFEHEAETKEQKAAVEKAKAKLAKPLALFKLPASASCSVSEVRVVLEGGDVHDDGEENHAEQADADHDDDERGGHTEFHVAYVLDCAKPANLTSIGFDYFKTFPGANELTVNVVTAKAQSTYEVSRDKPTLDLGSMM